MLSNVTSGLQGAMPYVSKTRGVNMIELATLAMLGKKFTDSGFIDLPEISHVGVKVPQFSFMRLSGADPVLGVEMLSTGEVACLGENFTDALSKAMQSAEFKMPPQGGSVLITVGGKELKKQVVPLGRALRKMGFKIYATQHTAEALRDEGVNNISVLHKVREVGAETQHCRLSAGRQNRFGYQHTHAQPSGDVLGGSERRVHNPQVSHRIQHTCSNESSVGISPNQNTRTTRSKQV